MGKGTRPSSRSRSACRKVIILPRAVVIVAGCRSQSGQRRDCVKKTADKFKLLRGPYFSPRVRVGRKLFCEIYGTVTVCGFSDSDFPWPKGRYDGKGAPSLILYGDLVKAVRLESEIAVAHYWGVSVASVRKWRRALGVPPINEGSHKLLNRITMARTDSRLERARQNSKSPAALAKASAKLKGRIVPQHVRAAVRKAAQRPRSEAWKRQMSAYWKRRGHPPGHPESRFWTKEEDALLGLASDIAVAREIGRTYSAVMNRRTVLGIPGHRKQKRRKPRSK
jgi:hypothetical protein